MKETAAYFVFEMAVRDRRQPLRQVNKFPLSLEKARQLARIGATKGKHDRAVTTSPKSPRGFRIVAQYAAGTGKDVSIMYRRGGGGRKKARPNSEASVMEAPPSEPQELADLKNGNGPHAVDAAQGRAPARLCAKHWDQRARERGPTHVREADVHLRGRLRRDDGLRLQLVARLGTRGRPADRRRSTRRLRSARRQVEELGRRLGWRLGCAEGRLRPLRVAPRYREHS